ncbi:universal stress protein [Sphingomonas sp. 66-10]|uniref:universal stress protein n=1 Tax=Sphingomonas sp. 66-10 TaxID=1895848 RepID=UPI002579D290|nr:universal stress protein [Sphingomonas sp. 66-10]
MTKEAMMKNVLLLIHDDEGQEARLQAALDLTRALDGHLSCIDVTLSSAMVGEYYSLGVAPATLIRDECEGEGRNKIMLEARLEHEDVPWDWADATGDLVDGVCDAAMLADIIVLNRKLGQNPYPDMGDVAGRILMRARAPVVAMPEDYRRLALKRALVAWDGQASAAATLRACVPILQRAEAVEIFMVRDGAEKAEPTLAAEYLSRHGVHASVRVLSDGLHAADQLIEAEAAAFVADYILMGAYTHGRLMETFGGVTKRMLRNARVPLILGH